MTEKISLGLTDSQKSPFNVEEILFTLGCCKICSLRFSGETRRNQYQEIHKSLEDNKILVKLEETNSANGSKIFASNPCIACLGLLQPPMCDKIIDKIVEAVKGEEYDNPTFNVAFTLPVSFYLRAHALTVFLADKYPQHLADRLPMGVVPVGVKEAWKFIFISRVAELINKVFDSSSDFRIQVDVQYEDDHSEIKCLEDMYPNNFKDQKLMGKKLRHLRGPKKLLFTRKSVGSMLTLSDREQFVQFYPTPPAVPTHAAFINNVLFEHSPIYIGGRYNKYVRDLPQTAWLVQRTRRLESSVHELIGDPVQALTKAQASKLISSGREDVDVRMLGSGRPFVLELVSPRHVSLTAEELRDLELRINAAAGGKILVSSLRRVLKVHLNKLKEGEEEKTKTYMAWCVAWGTDSASVEGLAHLTELVLQQKTPVRVLHRRPIHTRPRTVHWMRVDDIKCVPANDTTYFKLTLNTQAGTYIKEFIHGDFGRTKPSIGDLLGGKSADCLALDVESISLEWPPP